MKRAARPLGHEDFGHIGICRLCGEAVFLLRGGGVQGHRSAAQAAPCRGAGYTPRETMAGAA